MKYFEIKSQKKSKIIWYIIGVVVALIVIIVIAIILITYNKQISCIMKEGFNVATEYFKNNPGSVIIDSKSFKKIVNASNRDINRALLCVANAISYMGTSTDKNNQRITRFFPPPSATHAVISGYPVGACVLGESGNVYLGANFEFFAPLTNTVHGEQCAIHNAAVNKESSILKLAVNAAPCGHCRQYLVEIGDPTKLDVIFCSNKGNFINKKLSDIIPENFGPINLGQTETVFNHTLYSGLPQQEKYINTKGGKKAIEMCKQSYAPYSHHPCGVSLVFIDNSIVGGQSIENAAFNPSLSAFRGAMSLAALMGKNFTNLVTVYLCQGKNFLECPPTVTGPSKQNPSKQGYSQCIDELNAVKILIKTFNPNIQINPITLVPSSNQLTSIMNKFTVKSLRLPL